MSAKLVLAVQKLEKTDIYTELADHDFCQICEEAIKLSQFCLQNINKKLLQCISAMVLHALPSQLSLPKKLFRAIMFICYTMRNMAT